MTVFGEYSDYYNLLYSDKNYANETQFLFDLLKKYAPRCETILDLGCGTGAHAALMAQRGCSVVGVDRSESMLAAARQQ